MNYCAADFLQATESLNVGTTFVFDTLRLIAWIGRLVFGWLIANFGGFSRPQ